jgi:hypothetical protein
MQMQDADAQTFPLTDASLSFQEACCRCKAEREAWMEAWRHGGMEALEALLALDSMRQCDMRHAISWQRGPRRSNSKDSPHGKERECYKFIIPLIEIQLFSHFQYYFPVR